jgi:hypothetical protein
MRLPTPNHPSPTDRCSLAFPGCKSHCSSITSILVARIKAMLDFHLIHTYLRLSGKRESAHYFATSMQEFLWPASDSLAILWERMWKHLAIKGDACEVLQASAGSAAGDSCFLEKHSLSGIELGCQSSTISISRLEEVLSSGIAGKSGTRSEAHGHLPSVEAPRNSDMFFVLDMMESSSPTLLNESIATILSLTSDTFASRRPRALLLKLPATRPRHGLQHAVSQLWDAGYLSFAVSVSRLVPGIRRQPPAACFTCASVLWPSATFFTPLFLRILEVALLDDRIVGFSFTCVYFVFLHLIWIRFCGPSLTSLNPKP